MKFSFLDAIDPSIYGQEVYGPPPEPQGNGLNYIIPISVVVVGIVVGIIILIKKSFKKTKKNMETNQKVYGPPKVDFNKETRQILYGPPPRNRNSNDKK